MVEGIRKLALAEADVEHINEVLTMHMGPNFVLANLSVKFKDESRATDIEATVRRMEARIKTSYPEVKRIFIEAEAKVAPTSVAESD